MMFGHLPTPEADLRWRTFGRLTPDLPGGRQWPVLIFLHYFGGSARTWEPVIAALAGKYACTAMDLRGFGGSSVHEPASYGVSAMAHDVAAVIEYLQPAEYVLVGHSMGGKVALSLAADKECPPGLVGVVLIAPSPPTPEPMEEAERTRLLMGWGLEDSARETLRKITAKPLPEDLAALAVADMLRSSRDAWTAWLEHGSREDLSEGVGQLRVPLALLAGEEDRTITPELLNREIIARLSHLPANLQMAAARAAHLLPLEAPTTVARFITKAVGGWALRE